MSLEDNKAVVRRTIEALNARDLSALDAHSDEYRRELQQWLDTNPWGDHRIDITEMVAEGDRVVALVATQGVQSGEYEGIAPTGKHFTNRGVIVFRVQGGRITEDEPYLDRLTMVKQFGGTILPPAESGEPSAAG
jgi:predicted ester cyclase